MSPDDETKIAENKDQHKYFFRSGQNSPGFVGGLSSIMATIKEQSGNDVMYQSSGTFSGQGIRRGYREGR